MNYLKSQPLIGEWWEHSDKSHKFQGALTIDDNNRSTLVIDQPLQLAVDNQFRRHRTIFGRIISPYRLDITLFDSGTLNFAASSEEPDFATVRLYANKTLVGYHVPSETEKF